MPSSSAILEATGSKGVFSPEWVHSFGIILAELQNYGEHSIGPERLTGKFFIVEDGKVKQTQPPKVLSERFSKMSPLEFVESDIRLEEYLSEE